MHVGAQDSGVNPMTSIGLDLLRDEFKDVWASPFCDRQHWGACGFIVGPWSGRKGLSWSHCEQEGTEKNFDHQYGNGKSGPWRGGRHFPLPNQHTRSDLPVWMDVTAGFHPPGLISHLGRLERRVVGGYVCGKWQYPFLWLVSHVAP